MGPGAGVQVAVAQLGVDLDLRGFDAELPATRHRVPRVDRQVDHDLFHATRVDAHRAQVAARPEYDLHVFTDHTLDDPHRARQELVQIHHHCFDHLLAAESQQLPGQGCCTLRGPLELEQVIASLVAFGDAAEQDIG